jgi:hypothetical protein
MQSLTYSTVDGEAYHNGGAREVYQLEVSPDAAKRIKAALADVPLEMADDDGEGAEDAKATMAWATATKIVLQHVRLGRDAKNARPIKTYIKAASLSSWLDTIFGLDGVANAEMPMAFGNFHKAVEKALAKAPNATLAALQIQKDDLVAVQAFIGATGGMSEDEVARERQREYLNYVTMEQLTGAHEMLGALAWVYHMLGDHVTHDSRTKGSFNINSDIISKAVTLQRGMTDASELANDELAVGTTELAHAALPPVELDGFARQPGGPDTRGELRMQAGCWGMGKGEDKAKTHVIKQKFSRTVANFKTLAAITGGNTSGTKLAASAGDAYDEVQRVARRTGVLDQQAPLDLGSMRALEEKLMHLCGMLEAAPWKDKTMEERGGHVTSVIEAAQRASTRSSDTTQVATGAYGAEPKPKQGQGTVPKHYQDLVPIATSDKAYLALGNTLKKRATVRDSNTEMDVLQIAVTGSVKGSGEPLWAPLIHFIAEGGHCMQGGLVDPELEFLSDIARTSWGMAIGRAVALSLSMDGVTVPPSLLGLQMPDVWIDTSTSDWSKLNLGHVFRTATAAQRGMVLPKPTNSDSYMTSSAACHGA